MKKLFLLSLLIVSGFVSLGQTKHTVQIGDFFFEPSELTVNVGDVVEWVNSGSMIHTATSGTNCEPSGVYNSGNLAPGAKFSYTFNTAGAVNYFCIPHCGNMSGIVTVQAATSSKEADKEAFSIYPNPASDLVNLSLSLKAPGKVSCIAYDFAGREMTEELILEPSGMDSQILNIDVKNWASGVYILKVSIGGKYAFSHKLLRQ